VIGEEGDRLTICCDKCPVRLDLGPAAYARARNRTPSGWMSIGLSRHYCPQCANLVATRLAAGWMRSKARQPLLVRR
jgi:hypothetical protein